MDHVSLNRDAYGPNTRYTISCEGPEVNLFPSEPEVVYFASKSRAEEDISNLEVDPTQFGLQAVHDYPGLAATPVEFGSGNSEPGRQIRSDEKEALDVVQQVNLKKKTGVLMVIGTLAIIISVAVIITVIAKRRSTNSGHVPPPYHNSSVQSPPILSTFTSEAFDGSGLVLLHEPSLSNQSCLLYQHLTGQIRELGVGTENGNVCTPELSSAIMGDVRNGTPLATVSYTFNNSLMAHIFYVDSANILQEVIKSNLTREWYSGPLGISRYLVSESSALGLSACWLDNASISKSGKQEIRLFYGAQDNLIHCLKYVMGDDVWKFVQTFANSNGNNGVACKCASTKFGSVMYMFMINSLHQVEVWWKDLDTSSINPTSTHPVGDWTRGLQLPLNHTSHAKSSLHFNGYDSLYYQDPSNNVVRQPILIAAENSSFAPGDPSTIASAAYPGTHIAQATYNTEGNSSTVDHYYFQTNGSNIVDSSAHPEE